jgi:hypothetical protein
MEQHVFQKGDKVKIVSGYNAGFVGWLSNANDVEIWSINTETVTCWSRPGNMELIESASL